MTKGKNRKPKTTAAQKNTIGNGTAYVKKNGNGNLKSQKSQLKNPFLDKFFATVVFAALIVFLIWSLRFFGLTIEDKNILEGNPVWIGITLVIVILSAIVIACLLKKAGRFSMIQNILFVFISSILLYFYYMLTLIIPLKNTIFDPASPIFQAIGLIIAWMLGIILSKFVITEWTLTFSDLSIDYGIAAGIPLIIAILLRDTVKIADSLFLRFSCNNIAVLIGIFVSFEAIHNMLIQETSLKKVLELLISNININNLKKILRWDAILASCVTSALLLTNEMAPDKLDQVTIGTSIAAHLISIVILCGAIIYIVFFKPSE